MCIKYRKSCKGVLNNPLLPDRCNYILYIYENLKKNDTFTNRKLKQKSVLIIHIYFYFGRNVWEFQECRNTNHRL